MKQPHAIAAVAAAALAVSLWVGTVSAQSESATAEDGKSASDAPAETVSAPDVPLGANLTPSLGALPLGPGIIFGSGSGQPGSSSVSMAPGTLTAGVANEGVNAVRAPEAEPAPAPVAETAPEPVADTADVAGLRDLVHAALGGEDRPQPPAAGAVEVAAVVLLAVAVDRDG